MLRQNVAAYSLLANVQTCFNLGDKK